MQREIEFKSIWLLGHLSFHEVREVRNVKLFIFPHNEKTWNEPSKHTPSYCCKKIIALNCWEMFMGLGEKRER